MAMPHRNVLTTRDAGAPTRRTTHALVAGAIVLAIAAVGVVAATDDRAPERFRVRLDTTKGAVVIDCVRAWAPLGADRFYTLVTSGYYDDSAFFRVVAGKWAQFGISGRPETCEGVADAHDSRRSVP